MKIIPFVVCAVFLCIIVGVLCDGSSRNGVNAAHAIQIIAPVNHTLQLNLSELKEILNSDAIKDRYVVAVSIVGIFRRGKSFLLNFFLRYLYAQYKRHNTTDWIGEYSSSGNELRGFEWRGGRKRQTTGIQMWSEIFTHDYENGEKVAIILLDTQGIFDSQSSMHECSTIFAISTMLSSVQCYNLMQNILEDDLQQMQLFIEYGQLALEHSNEKPFQKLLFIVRDWGFPLEMNYGWHEKKVIDEFLTGNDEETVEMRDLRKRIDSSFDDIGAFLMPYPGNMVAQGRNFTGNIEQIDSEFVKYLKELMLGLFAPQNLIIKKVNGQKVRASDFVQYLEAYMNIFNGNTLPEPKTILMTTAEVNYLILQTDYLHLYSDRMTKSLANVSKYLNADELLLLHQKTKNESIEQFLTKPKLGSTDLIRTHQGQLDQKIDKKFSDFERENEIKRVKFIKEANLYNTKLLDEICGQFEEFIDNEIQSVPLYLQYSNLSNAFAKLEQFAFQEWTGKKMNGDEVVASNLRKELERSLNSYSHLLDKNFIFYTEALRSYSDSMQKSIDSIQPYVNEMDLMRLHEEAINETMSQEINSTMEVTDVMLPNFVHLLNQTIDKKFHTFQRDNQIKMTLQMKRTKEFIVVTITKANWFKAFDYCRDHGMKLASITSREESDRLIRHIKQSGVEYRYDGSYWTSGIRYGSDKFYWLSRNQEMTFTNWHKNEPNGLNIEEYCVEIVSKWQYEWNDNICKAELHFICEK